MRIHLARQPWLWTFLFLTTVLAPAQQTDKPGSKDHPLIGRFKGSIILGYDQRDYNEFVIALGPQTRDKNNKIVLEKSRRLEGKVTRILYLSPERSSTLQVYRSYERALKKAGFQELFSCFNPACGDLFKYTPTLSNELYGYTLSGHFRDERYLSAKLSRPEGDVYVSLFVFEHTSPHRKFGGRVLVQLDVIETEAGGEGEIVNAAKMAREIAAQGRVALYGIYFDTNKAEIKPESEPTLQEIARLLQADPGLKLYVVGHTDNVGSADYNIELSRRRAQAVVEALVSKYGISADRLSPYGVGLYAPVASNDTEEGRAKNRRVELVKQ